MNHLPIVLILFFTLSTIILARPNHLVGSLISLPSYHLNCESWRWAVEVNNARNWKAVPVECVDYIANYMTNTQNGVEPQWHADCKMAVIEGLKYLSTVTPTPNKNDAWIFGLADTLISSFPFFNRSDICFGEFEEAAYNSYLVEGEMPAVPYVPELYWAAKEKGFKIVILSGLSEEFRSIMESKLRKAGINKWDKLYFKDKASTSQKEYKTQVTVQLREEGYTVFGNVGDQWVDLLLGSNGGQRLIKLPNILYYDST